MTYKTIELKEHQEYIDLTNELLDYSDLLWSQYEEKLDIEFPSPRTGNRLKLCPRNWVGFIPLTSEFVLRISPKVTLKNLFGMVAYVYNLDEFKDIFQNDLIRCDAIEDCFEVLAELLARKVLDQVQQGLYRTYLSTTAIQPCVRGRLDVQYGIQRFWEAKLRCTYQELTGDIPDNQILAWTLLTVAQSGLCKESLSIVQRAYRALQGIVTVQPFTANDCIDRDYNRLNEDYQSLHALCRFLLESTAASHQVGEYRMLAFLVNMPNLFQDFVATWLSQELSQNYLQKYHLEKQVRYNIDLAHNLKFYIDLVLHDKTNQTVRCVLDTKYKTTLKTSDIQQIIAYAVVKQCNEAILIFPRSHNKQIDKQINNIRVRTLIFPLDKLDLDEAGKYFLKELLQS